MASQFPRRQCPVSLTQTNPLIDKLSRFATLDAGEVAALRAMSRNRKRLAAHEIIIHEGSKPCFAFAMMSGVAFRYKHLANGRRQIFGYLLPGDLCDTHFILARRADHSIGFLTNSEIAIIPLPELMQTMVGHPQVERAIRQASMLEETILREWLLNIGQRGAVQKLAHFLCEISARLEAVDMVEPDGSFSISLTQSELADTMGLTAVHVNRCLQRLRENGLLNWTRGGLSVIDRSRLIDFAEFDGDYLRLPPSRTAVPPPSPEPRPEWNGVPAAVEAIPVYA